MAPRRPLPFLFLQLRTPQGYSYLVGDRSTRRVVVIEPSDRAREEIQTLGLTVESELWLETEGAFSSVTRVSAPNVVPGCVKVSLPTSGLALLEKSDQLWGAVVASALPIPPASEFLPALKRLKTPSTLIFPARSAASPAADSDLLFSTYEREFSEELLDPGAAQPESRETSISIDKFEHKVACPEEGTLFLDVREAWEFEQGHIEGLRNIPLSELPFHLNEIRAASRCYVSCQSGRRSLLAARTLSYLGAKDVVNVSGGFQAWLQAGLPQKK